MESVPLAYALFPSHMGEGVGNCALHLLIYYVAKPHVGSTCLIAPYMMQLHVLTAMRRGVCFRESCERELIGV